VASFKTGCGVSVFTRILARLFFLDKGQKRNVKMVLKLPQK